LNLVEEGKRLCSFSTGSEVGVRESLWKGNGVLDEPEQQSAWSDNMAQ